jgi:hypothetical protein
MVEQRELFQLDEILMSENILCAHGCEWIKLQTSM